MFLVQFDNIMVVIVKLFSRYDRYKLYDKWQKHYRNDLDATRLLRQMWNTNLSSQKWQTFPSHNISKHFIMIYICTLIKISLKVVLKALIDTKWV